ncbi:Patatin protein 2 [Spatholobus suberectus]|nr:Patatin protein 2 [Spatholobus suberectus]
MDQTTKGSVSLTPCDDGHLVTVLSIDGGGIRGIIPGIILGFLESELQCNGTEYWCSNLFSSIVKFSRTLFGPQYNGKYLHRLTREKLGDTKLHQTLTNVVIPAFDIKRLQPTIFSSFQALVAIAEVTNQISHDGPCDSLNVEPMQYDRFLVISLGTGSQKQEMKYSADEAAQWGILSWVATTNGGTPLIDAFSHASADMVDFHISSVVRALNSEHNYLRIQDDTLTGDLSSVDLATEKNLNDLVKVGESLLKKPVSKINLKTGIYEPAKYYETNEEALKRFAGRLSRQKRFRKSQMSANGHL